MKKAFVLVFCIFSVQYAMSQCDSIFGFYTLNTSTKDLCFVDTVGNITTIGQTGLPDSYIEYQPYRSMDFDKNGNLWFLLKDTLYLINTETGSAQATKIISGISTGAITGFSFDSGNQLFIHSEVTSTPAGRINKVSNFLDGTASQLPNSTGVETMYGIEFDDDNNLWTINSCCVNKVYQINTATGQVIANSFPAFSLGYQTDLDFSNGGLYGVNFYPKCDFYEVNRINGQTRTLFTLDGIYMGIAGSWKNINIMIDTTHVTINDTIFITVNDTTHITVNDTVPITVYDSVAVTDTLIIDVVLTGIDPPSNHNSIKVYPNPTKNRLIIENGDFTKMTGYMLKISNISGDIVFESIIDQRLFDIDLNTFGGKGTYILHILDDTSGLLETRKIILQ